MIYFITGAAGFIASNMVDYLLSKGNVVIGFDNLSTGRKSFLTSAYNDSNFSFILPSLLNVLTYTSKVSGPL